MEQQELLEGVREANSPDQLIEELGDTETRGRWMGSLEQRGQIYKQNNDLDFGNLHTVEIGFLLTLWDALGHEEVDTQKLSA